MDKTFSGQIGYHANHSSFDHPVMAANIWRHPAIDYVSISAYFPLATQAVADRSGDFGDREFVDAVRTEFDKILDTKILPYVSTLRTGPPLPVMLGEFGVIPYDRTSTRPWDWKVSDKPDPAEQHNVYQALLEATDGRRDRVSVVHLWIWGWEGGLVGERYALRPDGRQPNEVLARNSAELFRSYLTQPLKAPSR